MVMDDSHAIAGKRRAPRQTAVYRRIEQDMRKRVVQGDWTPGMMIPSRKSLSTEYGVDLRTVQRAIASLLDDGTLTAHGGRGTFVRQESRSEQKTFSGANGARRQSIGVVVDQLINPGEMGPRAISAAIHSAIRTGAPEFVQVSFDSYSDSVETMAEREKETLDLVEQENLAGLIVWHSGGEQTVRKLQQIINSGVPVVLIDRYSEGLDCDFVGVDNTYAAMEAVNYLVSLGHRRIGFLAPLEQISSIEERLAGYRDALTRAQLEPSPDLEFRLPLARSLDLASLAVELNDVVDRMRQASDRVTAVFAVNDFLAHLLSNSLIEHGLDVPGDVSVVGFDDIDRYSPRTPFLTTMRQPFEAIGERAADLLLRRLRAPKDSVRPATYRHVLLPSQLIVRKSTAPPA